MTSIEEEIRSGAVRLVPVEATDGMHEAADRYEGRMRRGAMSPTTGGFYRAMLSAATDHTPALLALIEERDRLKVERDEAWGLVEKERAAVLDMNSDGAAWSRRALAAEAKCDALREALDKAEGDLQAAISERDEAMAIVRRAADV